MSYQRLFITGGTGYIGGSVLDKLVKEYPHLHVAALLRKTSAEFTTRYPQITVVQGDFDSFDIIEKAASEADIIIHTGDIDHEGCARALLSGCQKNPTKSFLIHLTGTGCISDEREQEWKGEENPRVWNDIDDIKEIYGLPKEARHHEIDMNIMDASNEKVKTAIICPPDIYGAPTGIGGKSTYLVPEYVKILLEKKEAFYLGEGQNLRAVTYIQDVVSLFMILVGEATKGGGKAQWGKEGFYFAVAEEVRWKEVAAAIAAIGVKDGWLPQDSTTASYNREQVSRLLPHFGPIGAELALYIWGSNSRANSARAATLGWVPNGPRFWDQLEEDVSAVVKSLNV